MSTYQRGQAVTFTNCQGRTFAATVVATLPGRIVRIRLVGGATVDALAASVTR